MDETRNDGPASPEGVALAASRRGEGKPARRGGFSQSERNGRAARTMAEWGQADPAAYRYDEETLDQVEKKAILSLTTAMRPSILKIDWCREKRGMASSKLEKLLGLKERTWSKVVSGDHRALPPEIVAQSAAILGIEPEFLAATGDWTKYPEEKRLRDHTFDVLAQVARERRLETADEAQRVMEAGVACKINGIHLLDLLEINQLINDSVGPEGGRVDRFRKLVQEAIAIRAAAAREAEAREAAEAAKARTRPNPEAAASPGSPPSGAQPMAPPLLRKSRP